MDNFDRQARAAQAHVVGRATEEIRAVGQELVRMLQDDAKGADHGSPIASGRFVSSIRLGINEIDTSVEPADPKYVYPPGKGPRTLPPRTIANTRASAFAAKLRTFKLGDTIWVSNSLPYSRRIEIGRHSWQAPDGVFERTVRAVVRKFRNARFSVRLRT